MTPKTISEEQRLLNQQLHTSRPDFGSQGGAGNENVIHALRRYHKLKTLKSVLDYGTGKGAFPNNIKKAIPTLKVSGYDPAVKEFSTKPENTFDLVTCFDVLEHVERDSISAVIEEIKDLSNKLVFLQIDLQPAVKRLSSGRNAHIMLAPQDWWLSQVGATFPILGSYPVYHSTGIIQKVAIIATKDPQYGPLVWSMLMKMQSKPMNIVGGYLGGKLKQEKTSKKTKK
jgi:hypothetical protein|tara:strand:- start:361 stop:1044 length:684 start_codon:yes stop_codon:yes gene_type:complete